MSDQPRESTVVDPAIERRIEEERQERIIRHRAESFLELEKHPAWQELVDEMGRKRERLRQQVAANYFTAGAQIDQRQVDYDRGFADGTRYISSVVSAAENTLKKLDKVAEDRATADAEAAALTEPENETGEWD